MEKLYNSDGLLAMMEGDKIEVKELALMLFDLGPQMINEIETAISDKNWAGAGDIAHKLKSTLKLWQMDKLVSLAYFIEKHGEKAEKTDEIVSSFNVLKTNFDKALKQMKLEFS